MPIDQIDNAAAPEAPSKPPKPDKKSRVATKKSDGRLAKNKKPRIHDIKYVAMYLDLPPEKTPAAMTLTAKGMLEWARLNKDKFWTNLYPRLLAAEGKQEEAAKKMRDDGRELNRLFEALERERPDLAALSRKKATNVVTGPRSARCPHCRATFTIEGTDPAGQVASAAIGHIGSAESAQISQ